MRTPSMKLWLLAVVCVTASIANGAQRSSASSGGQNSFYIGSALDGVFSASNTVPAISALFPVGPKSAVQAYFSLPGSSPVQLGGGAAFKHTLSGDAKKGFHVGGGLALGTRSGGVGSSFFINIAPLMGVHFELVSNVLVALDSSLAIQINTAGGGGMNLSIGGNSGLLGASVLIGL